MWFENQHEDARIFDMSVSTIPDEDVGIVPRLETSQDNFDVMNEVGQGNRFEIVEHQNNVLENMSRDGPRSEIPRAGKAHTLDYIGEPRRVRKVFEVMHTLLPSEERGIIEEQPHKQGRGRKKVISSSWLSNGSLSDSDFQSQKRVILKEARDTLALGKFLGAQQWVRKRI
ncbi:hypothetical protein V6N11_060552 [Hibiscus sabdariffa]|uniref:Uncharacterized protein n=1 Tax=Hibiscus sabdariffa TaxID=183260 RepID=A0ABR2QQN8_9ROSI